MLTYLTGGGDVTWITVGSLVGFGVVLTVSPVVYRTIEKVEVVKVALTLFFLAVVAVAVIGWHTWSTAGEKTVTSTGRIPDGITFTMILSAIGAAGAGGVHNLVLSNWIRDKGYGMGAHVPSCVCPITGQSEASGANHYAFPQDEANLARWRVWWRRANTEHNMVFHSSWSAW
ncbi:Manganese transporter OS=Streptomyces antimycoticus OX=68175 GN=SANT12839_060290 PE=4 SV=1 [Streptomyces antimycoticus]